MDASGLEGLSAIEMGRIAVVGTAVGGKPSNAIVEVDDYVILRSPRKVRSTYRSGDLREACLFAFQPCNDPRIPNGASSIVAMKVNPAMQSTLTLVGDTSLSAVILSSRDYGAFTEQVNIKVEVGASGGNYRKVTTVFEGTTEVKDDIGGVSLATLQYAPGTYGWLTTMTVAIVASGQVTALGTRLCPDTSADVTNAGLAAPDTLYINVANAGDITKVLTVYGIDGSNAPVSQDFTITATGDSAEGTVTFAAGVVLGCVLRTAAGALATAAGTIDVRDGVGGAGIVLTLTVGETSQGCAVGQAMYVTPGTTPTIYSSGTSTARVPVFGRTAGGAVVSSAVALSGAAGVGNAVSITATTWAQIEVIVTGGVTATETVTMSGSAAQSTVATHNTLQRLADFFNAKRASSSVGFIWTNVTGRTGTAHTDLDIVSATTILSVALGLRGDIAAFVSYINTSSAFLTATKVSGAIGPVKVTSGAVFLAGGIEGVVTTQHWTDAFEQLHRLHVDTIACTSDDPAVHALLRAHLIERVGVDEADGVVGLSALSGQTPTGLVPGKTSIKAQIVALNSQHIRAVAQSFQRFDSGTTGQSVLTTFEPRMATALVAGAQAGAPPALALTRKYFDVQAVAQDSTWNPTEDSDEMIDMGTWLFERVEGIGVRSVRDITTYLIDNNFAFCEASVNRLSNLAVRDLRQGLDALVGMPGFSGTVNSLVSISKARLNRQLTTVPYPMITAWRALEAEIILDVGDVSCEIAPVIPLNFIRPTIHLVAGSLRAAA